ncbi:MAG: aminotransferase class I/II-fold pyridoxal phosphate-dependent enzyme, partial [Planctomycetota bacterium]
MQTSTMISDRTTAIDVSGIRRVFELGAKLSDPINLSIGQPDFPVPDPIKDATIDAIRNDQNGYTLTQGTAPLLARLRQHLADDVGWSLPSEDLDVMVTSGTSGGLLLAFLALLNPGDEAIIGDPYFVVYPAMARMCDAKAVYCDTYPDFRMTAERLEPLISERTKLVLINSPGNPSGVVMSNDDLREVVDLCARRNVMLISDEIYDEFTFDDAREQGKCPSPARMSDQLLLIRGFGKTYGCTGWRLGYAAGPTWLLREMKKLQQYTFVCAPSMAQAGAAAALDVDMDPIVSAYAQRRDLVESVLGDVMDIAHPGGAFYAFAKVPDRLGMTATAFVEQAIERNVLIIPGSVFSRSDTHVRISFATPVEKLQRGLD